MLIFVLNILITLSLLMVLLSFIYNLSKEGYIFQKSDSLFYILISLISILILIVLWT